ncbi:MAG TPA: HAD hydrolase-like protein [Baekduia sp.]|nr:HAD hydrolase-like protein [Baekduia sp.]
MTLLDADAVLFDLDGVLVDSRKAFARSVNAALAQHGLPERDAEELHTYLGPPLHRTFASLGAVDDQVDALVLSYRARYRTRMADESAVFAGIPAALDALAAAMPLVVATSKPQALAEPLLEQLGLRDRFQAVYGPSLQARDGAKSLTIARALEGLPHARRAVMVGDRKFDVLGARAHELPCVGVLWGIGSERELREAGAAALVHEPGELVALLGAA